MACAPTLPPMPGGAPRISLAPEARSVVALSLPPIALPTAVVSISPPPGFAANPSLPPPLYGTEFDLGFDEPSDGGVRVSIPPSPSGSGTYAIVNGRG